MENREKVLTNNMRMYIPALLEFVDLLKITKQSCKEYQSLMQTI